MTRARILLATDLARTRIPNGVAAESPGARQRFARVASRPEVMLAYVSGRHRALVEEAIAEYTLPLPDFVIGDVGTTIYQVQDSDWREWPDWHQVIGVDWAGYSATDLRAMLAPLAALTPQEDAKQNRYKLSYYALPMADPAPLLDEVHARLESEGVRANLVWSIDEAADCGLLDVLPAGASKLHALEFLCGKLDIDYAHAVFAGDSGNDLEVLGGPLRSVLVANASEDVREQAIELAADRGNAGRLYLARGEAGGMNGNYSAGILEGLAYFLPETRGWWD
jgi:HAD superfamily hydrolase (TIGR01484 family)